MVVTDRFSQFSKDRFVLSRSILVIVASMGANVFAYLFQLISGRYFSIEDYAIIVALFSLSGIIPLVVLVFTNGIGKLVAEIKDDDYPNRISLLFYSLLKVHLVISVAVLVILIASSSQIASYLHIEDISLIIIFSVAVTAGILTSFMTPFLQGLMRFKAYSFVLILGAIGKFTVIAIIVVLGLSVLEIYLGLAITTIVMGIIAFLILRKNIIPLFRGFATNDVKTLIKYSVGGAFAIVGITLLQNTDIILVKHFFSPTIAGIYSSTSVIGRIIFYAASPVAVVMLPICAQKYKKGEDYMKPFLSSLGLTFLIAAAGTITYWLFPHFVITILFGKKYLPAEEYLPGFAIFMMLFALVSIIAWFLIAISKFKIAALTLLAAILQFIGIQMFHENLHQVIMVSIISVAITLVIMVGWIIKNEWIPYQSLSTS